MIEAALYAVAHRDYLRAAHPDAWRAMVADGTLDDHCRRRGIEAAEMADGLRINLQQQIVDGERSAADSDAIAHMAQEAAHREQLRCL